MTKLNKALMASTAIAFACGLALPASAQDPAAAPGVVSSGSKMKIKLYGQIARVFGVVDDGDGTTFKTGENGNTATRMGMDARGKINNDVSVRTRFEYAVQSGNNGGGSQFQNQGGDVQQVLGPSPGRDHLEQEVRRGLDRPRRLRLERHAGTCRPSRRSTPAVSAARRPADQQLSR